MVRTFTIYQDVNPAFFSNQFTTATADWGNIGQSPAYRKQETFSGEKRNGELIV